MTPSQPPVSGLLNVYKPAGPTSHDLVAGVRRGTGVRKVGHGGTLDPLATGVLVLCLGAATRLSEYVMGSPKTYVARLFFGVETDTYDAEGEVTARCERLPELGTIRAALDGFRGPIEQVPPMYSAIKQGGRRLYELARDGQEVERAPRPVTIDRLELLAWEPPVAVLEIVCSPGTYIRSLAHDIGQVVGTGAHLTALERTASGMFAADHAVRWPVLEAAMQAGTWQEYLLPPDVALGAMPAVYLDAVQAARVRQGGQIERGESAPGPDGLARAYDPEGRFLAVLLACGDHWQPRKVFG